VSPSTIRLGQAVQRIVGELLGDRRALRAVGAAQQIADRVPGVAAVLHAVAGAGLDALDPARRRVEALRGDDAVAVRHLGELLLGVHRPRRPVDNAGRGGVTHRLQITERRIGLLHREAAGIGDRVHPPVAVVARAGRVGR